MNAPNYCQIMHMKLLRIFLITVLGKKPPRETSWWLAKNKENQHKNAFCRYFSSLMCFLMPHTVITFGLMMFCELLIYHFIKTQLSFAYQKWL